MGKLIRIVHVTSSLTSVGGGVREAVLNLSLSQLDVGSLDVHVVGLNEPLWESERSEWATVPVYANNIFGPKSYGYSYAFSRTLSLLNPDLVHLHGLWMYPAYSVFAWHKRTGRPYIVSVHGMLSPVALSYGNVKKKIINLLYHEKLLSSASAIHSTSDMETSEIRAYGLSNDIVELANGVHIPTSTNKLLSRRKKVLYFGRIHKKKGLFNLLHAWAIVQHLFSDWTLEIVGPDEGGELGRLKSLSLSLNLSRVDFRGPVMGHQKWDLLSSASIFVLPTLSDNFAITVAESLACGVPVVSSKGAPWARLEEQMCGKWVDIGVDPLVVGLTDLMSLSDYERQEMGLKGRLWMQREFSWSSIARDFSKHYLKYIKCCGNEKVTA